MFYWLSLVKSIWNKISPKKSKKTVLDEVKLEKLDQTTNSYNRKPNELDTLENRSLTAEEAGTNLEDSEIKNITLQRTNWEFTHSYTINLIRKIHKISFVILILIILYYKYH